MKTWMFLLLFSPSVLASDWILHLGSYHPINRDVLARENSLNEVNIGIGYVGDGFRTGFYKNSGSDMSFYISREKDWLEYGLVAGYDIPVLPYVKVNKRIGDFEVSAIPAFTNIGRFIPVVTLSYMF